MAPAAAIVRQVRMTFSSLPNPVSMSTIIGSGQLVEMRRTLSANSVAVIRPMSGRPT